LRLVAEVVRATGDVGAQWILDLCGGVVKEDWRSGVVLSICRGGAALWGVDGAGGWG